MCGGHLGHLVRIWLPAEGLAVAMALLTLSFRCWEVVWSTYFSPSAALGKPHGAVPPLRNHAVNSMPETIPRRGSNHGLLNLVSYSPIWDDVKCLSNGWLMKCLINYWVYHIKLCTWKVQLPHGARYLQLHSWRFFLLARVGAVRQSLMDQLAMLGLEAPSAEWTTSGFAQE